MRTIYTSSVLTLNSLWASSRSSSSTRSRCRISSPNFSWSALLRTLSLTRIRAVDQLWSSYWDWGWRSTLTRSISGWTLRWMSLIWSSLSSEGKAALRIWLCRISITWLMRPCGITSTRSEKPLPKKTRAFCKSTTRRGPLRDSWRSDWTLWQEKWLPNIRQRPLTTPRSLWSISFSSDKKPVSWPGSLDCSLGTTLRLLDAIWSTNCSFWRRKNSTLSSCWKKPETYWLILWWSPPNQLRCKSRVWRQIWTWRLTPDSISRWCRTTSWLRIECLRCKSCSRELLPWKRTSKTSLCHKLRLINSSSGSRHTLLIRTSI